MGWDIDFVRVSDSIELRRIQQPSLSEDGTEQWCIAIPEGFDLAKSPIAPRADLVRFLLEDWGAQEDQGADTVMSWRTQEESLGFYLHDDPVTCLGTDNHASIDTLLDLHRRLDKRWPRILIFEPCEGNLHDEWTFRKLCGV